VNRCDSTDGKPAAVSHSEFDGRCDAIVAKRAADCQRANSEADEDLDDSPEKESAPPSTVANRQHSGIVRNRKMTERDMEKNSDADSLFDGKPETANRSKSLATPRSSRPLRNWKHEKFARLVVEGTEPADAYVAAGFERHRANHHRLMRRLKDRIDVLRCEREMAARAARVPISQVIEELDRRGLVQIEDFFERNAAGILSARNLEKVPVEIALALLKALGEGFGIHEK
jgi:hypothetical protein